MNEGQEVSRLAEIHEFVFAGLENQHARGARYPGGCTIRQVAAWTRFE